MRKCNEIVTRKMLPKFIFENSRCMIQRKPHIIFKSIFTIFVLVHDIGLTDETHKVIKNTNKLFSGV